MNKIKSNIFLFTDGSVNPKNGIGFGAYLLMDKLELSSTTVENEIQIEKFENTSSTKLELETLLWTFDNEDLQNYKVVVYTDCQNIIGLRDRKERFEKNNYMTSKNKVIKNHELYKDFFYKLENLDCEFIKVKGHRKASEKNEIDEIFTLVDRATRRALRTSTL